MLTKSERLVAARRAASYPPRRGLSYFAMDVPERAYPEAGHGDITRLASREPFLLRLGGPEIAVAEFRSELTREGVQRALTDLAEAVPKYLAQLDDDPMRVAAILGDTP